MFDAITVIKQSNAFDERRSRYLVFASWIILPAMLFPLSNSTNTPLAAMAFAFILIVILANVAVVRADWQWGKARLPDISIVYACACCVYFTYLGYGEGGSLTWMYVLPPIALYLRGLFWGATVCVVVGGINVTTMVYGHTLGGFEYPGGMTSRFAVSFFLLTALTFGYEYWRVLTELEKESLNSQLTITRSALSEFASICAWCHSIRDADGQWHTLEKHLEITQNKQVSHSICATCAQKQLAQQ